MFEDDVRREFVVLANTGALSAPQTTLMDDAPPLPPPLVNKELKESKSMGQILNHAGNKALAGGIPGAAAMGVQVGCLMWLRTTINYQYRHGTSTLIAMKTLYSQGGIPRFYAGVGPALLQGPLSRFGDTAANAGTMALLEDVSLPPALKTVAASASAGAFRIALMPLDAVKTIMQVEGKTGIASLSQKIAKGGMGVLYHGSMASAAATFVGHYPWFATYNTLNDWLPKHKELHLKLFRSAFIGFCSSFISDVCSNSIRVIKTSKQASTVPVTYMAVAREIIAKEGVLGVMGRGLGTKIISNGIQGIMFSVLWRLGQDYLEDKERAAKESQVVTSH